MIRRAYVVLGLKTHITYLHAPVLSNKRPRSNA